MRRVRRAAAAARRSAKRSAWPARSVSWRRSRGTDDAVALATSRGSIGELAALPLAERRRVAGLDPDRAPVIVAGALIVRTVLERYGLDELRFSERDLLDGAALEAAELPAPDEGAAPPGAYTCC